MRCCAPESPHLPLHKPQGDHTDTSQSRGVSVGTGGVLLHHDTGLFTAVLFILGHILTFEALKMNKYFLLSGLLI